jgi:hypothetical protein
MKFIIAAMVALAAAPVWSAEPLDQRAFAADMVQRLQEKLPGAVLTPQPEDPLAITVEGGGWDDAQFNLHRIFGYCAQSTAEDCKAAKAEFAQKMTKRPAKATPANLRFVVRDAQYLAYIRQLQAEKGRSGQKIAIAEAIGEDLFAVLAADSPDQIAVVGDKLLKELALSEDKAWEFARKQTAAVLPPMPTAAQLSKSAVALEGEEYLASLVADLPAWGRLAEAVGPDLFVTLVSDQFVFVGTMPDGPGLIEFRKAVAEDCAAQQRCISPNVYRFRDGRWVISR